MHSGPGSLCGRVRFVAAAAALGLGVASVPAAALAGPAPEASGSTAPAASGSTAPAEAPTSAPSDGDTTRAAILPLAVEGDAMPEADRDQLAGRLVEGLRRGDFEVIAPDEVLAASASADSCRAAGCYTAIAKATGASHVVLAVISVDDRDYEVEVVLVDGSDGTQVASAEDSCQICGVAEVGDLIDTAAATLRTKLDNLAQGPAKLSVSSTPTGAQVSIDGELKGTTPFNAPVLAGKHVLRISLDGYITVEREVNFVEGIEDVQSFDLEKVPSRLPARPWGWVSLGLGVAGLGAAVAFTVIADEPYRVGGACDEPDPNGQCPELWNTEPIVLGTAIAGAALTTLGVAILLSSAGRRGKTKKVEAKSEPAPAGKPTARRRRLRFGVGPGSVSLQGRF